MKRVALLGLGLGLAGCSTLFGVITGLQNFLPVSGLVDNVAFLPADQGRTTPDSAQTTFVGAGLNALQITFLDTLDPSSVVGFSIANNLEFVGVAPDPLRAPFFNTTAMGLVRPYQVLTVPLRSPVPVGGPFHVELVSQPGGNLLRTMGSSNTFEGIYDIAFQVVARNGQPPFVSQVVTSVGTLGALDPATVLAGGPVVSFVEPHSQVEIDFSTQMRPGVPVRLAPAIPTPTTVPFQGQLLSFSLPLTPGLSLNQSVATDPSSGLSYTVLKSNPSAGPMVLGASYQVTVPSDTSLAIQSTFAEDPLGQALVPNVAGGALAHTDFQLTLNVSGIAITSPASGSWVNAAQATAGIQVRGAVIGSATAGMVLDVYAPIFPPSGPSGLGVLTADVPISAFHACGLNQFGVQVDCWSATVPPSAFLVARNGALVDGFYRVVARTVSQGTDSINLRVDRSPPVVAGITGTLDIQATALADPNSIGEVCVNVAPSPGVDGATNDAASAQLFYGPNGTGRPLAVSATPQLMPDGSAKFCFPDVFLPGGLPMGVDTLSVMVLDAAGNSTIANFQVRVHPTLLVLSPQDAQPGDTVTISGFGLAGLTGADSASFDGNTVALSAGINVDNSPPQILKSVVPGRPHDPDLITFVLPRYVGSGLLSLTEQGLASNSVLLEICTPPVGPFVANGLDDVTSLIDSEQGTGVLIEPFLGSLTHTGLSAALDFFGNSVKVPAGEPLLASWECTFFVAGTCISHGIVARTWSGSFWTYDALVSENDQGGIPAVLPVTSAARRPTGDALVASLVDGVEGTQVRLSRRVPSVTSSSPAWSTQTVITLPRFNFEIAGTPPTHVSPAGLSLAISASGRAGLAFVGGFGGGGSALYVAIEDPPGSEQFPLVERIAVPTALVGPKGLLRGVVEPGAAISAAFDSSDDLYLAYNDMLSFVVPQELVSNAIPDDQLFAIHAARVSLSDPAPLFLPFPGAGFAPSVAVEPASNSVFVAYQQVNSLRSVGPPEFLAVELGPVLRAPLTSGTLEQIDGRDFGLAYQLGGISPVSFDPGLSAPRTSLRFGADGIARAAYGTGGESRVAVRSASGAWESSTVALGHTLGGGLQLDLDGAGRARLAFDDMGLGQSLLRLTRQEDNWAVDPGFGDIACNTGTFTRKAVPFALTNTSNPIQPFVDAHDHYAFSIESLLALQDFQQLSNFFPPPGVTEQAAQVFFTALSGAGFDQNGADAQSSYEIYTARDTSIPPNPSSNFVLRLPQLRNSGQREIDSLAGSVSSFVQLPSGAKVPTAIVLLGHVRGAAADFAVTESVKLDQNFQLVFTSNVGCFSLSSDPSICSLSARDIQVLSGKAEQLFAFTAGLALLPSAEDISQRIPNTRIDLVDLSLHGALPAAAFIPGTAGNVGLRSFAQLLEINGVYDASGCGSLPFSIASRNGVESIGFGGPLETADLLPLLGRPTVFPFLSISPNPTVNVTGGNDICRTVVNQVFRGDISAMVGSQFGNAAIPASAIDVIGNVLIDPPLEDVLARSSAGGAWSLYVRSDNQIEATIPP